MTRRIGWSINVRRNKEHPKKNEERPQKEAEGNGREVSLTPGI